MDDSNTTVLEMRDAYRITSNLIGELIQEQKELKERMQEQCDHGALAEVDYRSGGVIESAQAPRRLCLICGLEEKGWGSGYVHLWRGRTIVEHCGSNRDKFYELRSLDFNLKTTFAKE